MGIDSDALKFQLGNVLDGQVFTEYYHAKPITPEIRNALLEKRAKGKLSANEWRLLDEFHRAQHYEDRLRETEVQTLDPRILYIGSGFDGLPGSVFGHDHMTMVSLTPKDFSRYRATTKGFTGARQVLGDFFSLREHFPDDRFATFVVNGLSIFNPRELARYRNSSKSPPNPQQIFEDFWRQVRSVSSPGGVLIATGFDDGSRQVPTSALIAPEVRTMLETNGWKIDQESYVEESYCRLVAI